MTAAKYCWTLDATHEGSNTILNPVDGFRNQVESSAESMLESQDFEMWNPKNRFGLYY